MIIKMDAKLKIISGLIGKVKFADSSLLKYSIYTNGQITNQNKIENNGTLTLAIRQNQKIHFNVYLYMRQNYYVQKEDYTIRAGTTWMAEGEWGYGDMDPNGVNYISATITNVGKTIIVPSKLLGPFPAGDGIVTGVDSDMTVWIYRTGPDGHVTSNTPFSKFLPKLWNVIVTDVVGTPYLTGNHFRDQPGWPDFSAEDIETMRKYIQGK